MNPLLAAALVLLLSLAYVLLVRHYERRARKAEAEWNARPALYALAELQAWYAEHRELAAAGLLDPDQPTPWSHALDRIARYGTFKDRAQLRMVINGAASDFFVSGENEK